MAPSLKVDSLMARNRALDRIFNAFVYLFFGSFCFLILYPFWFIVINSINADLIFGTAMIWPTRLTVSNYLMVFSDPAVVRSMFVSIMRVVVGSVAAVVINSLCAFSLRKKNLAFRSFYVVLFTVPQFFVGGLIPTYLNLKMLGMLDTFLVYIFPTYIYNLSWLLFLMTAFNDIPDTLEESAHLDGAGAFTVYRRIYMPLAVPVLVTIILFAGVSQWLAWFDTLYFTRSESLQTFAAFLMKVVRKFSNLEVDTINMDVDDLRRLSDLQGIRFSAMIIGTLPVVMVYPFLQKFFVKGVRLGSMKE